MSYGTTLEEKINIIKAEYKRAADAYTEMDKLFISDINLSDSKALDLILEKCHSCHDSLFCAFEHILKALTEEPVESQSNNNFLSLINLAKKLDEISAGYRNGIKYPGREIDYTAAQKVDLNTIVTTKDVRNDLTHSAIIREARHYERLFENLKRLIKLLVPDFDEPIPSIRAMSKSEIFGHFLQYMEKFEAPGTCAYILIIDTVWDIPDEQFKFFLSLPWNVVIDLDGRRIGKEGNRDRSHVEKAIYSNGEETISIFALKAEPSMYSLNSSAERIPYLNFSDGDISLNLHTEKTLSALYSELTKAKKNNSNAAVYAQNNLEAKIKKLDALNEFLKRYLGDYDRAIIVSLAEVFNSNNSAQQIVHAIAHKFSFDIKIALLQDTIEDTDKLPDGIDESMYMNLDCELRTFFYSIYQNKELVAGCMSVADKRKAEDGYRFILRDKEGNKVEKIIPRNEAIKNAEEYFELLHLDSGQEFSQDDVERFYRGHIAEWSALKKKCDAQIAPDTRKKLSHQLVSSFTTDPEVEHTYYIMHEPGSGGTTLGRRIAWDIHENYPVVVLKHFDNKLMNRIEALYRALDYTPFLILADVAHGVSDENIDDFIKMMKAPSSLRPVVTLVVRRKRGGNSPYSKNIWDLPTLNNESMNIIKAKCMEYAVRLYDSAKEMHQHVQELEEHIIDEKTRTPMIINMYIMDKNFRTPKEYVRTLINRDHLPENIITVLKYVSIYSLYTDNYLSTKYLASVYNVDGMANENRGFQIALEKYNRLFLFRYGNTRAAMRIREPGSVRCIHPLFAEEILRYLMGDEWGRGLGSESLNFVESAMRSLTDEKTTEALQWMFSRKNEKYYEETENQQQRIAMSPLINAVMNVSLHSDGIELLKKVAERVDDYVKNNATRIREDKATDYSHILNLSARLWAQCARYYRRVNYDETKMDQYTELSLEALDKEGIEAQAGFQDLYHMAGMCWYKKLSKRLEEAPDDASDENIAQVKKIYETAINYYEKCVLSGNIDYGLPSMLATYALVLKYIFNMLGFFSEEYRPEKLDDEKFHWVQIDVIDAANFLIDNVEQYAFDDEARGLFDKYAYEFRNIYLLGNSSKVLQDLSNYIDRLKRDGQEHPVSLQQAYTQMVYSVMRKYYDEKGKKYNYLSLYDNKDDLKKVKSCIDNALNYSGGKSNFVYRTWFKLAKIEDASFTEAWQRAIDWAAVASEQWKPGQKREFRPYYYMYIISLLSGQPKENVARNWNQLQKNIGGIGNSDEWILDYYTSGKTGMGCLIDREWVTHDDIVNNDTINWVAGRIVHVSEDETVGWLDISISDPQLKHLIKRQHKGEGQIFFKPRTAEKTLGQRMEEVKFKFGFTLTRLRAVDATLLERKVRDHDRKPCEKDKGSEPLKVNVPPSGWVQFIPIKLLCLRNPTNPDLLIGKVGGKKASLHISDIRKYTPSELNAFNGEGEVLRLLSKIKSFYVIIMEKNATKGHRVSIHATSQKLTDIFKRP